MEITCLQIPEVMQFQQLTEFRKKWKHWSCYIKYSTATEIMH